MDSHRKNLPGVEMFNQKNKENQDNQITVKQGVYSFTDANGTCRIGQTVAKLTGTASYSNGKYTITLTKNRSFKVMNVPQSVTLKKIII